MSGMDVGQGRPADSPLFDPVCGAQIDPSTAAVLEHDGRDQLFCSEFCRARFRLRPEEFTVSGRPPVGEPLQLGLEELTAATEPGWSRQISRLNRRWWVALVLTVGVVALQRVRGTVPSAEWWELALSTPVVLWAGQSFFREAWSSIRSRTWNIATLIAMGIGVAWSYSVVATLFPRAFPPSFAHDGRTVDVYFESAAIVTTFALLGQLLELRARNRFAVTSSLRELSPDTVSRLDADAGVQRVPLGAVAVGDHVTVAPGEVIPVDGTVVRGRSSVDETLLTGDPQPTIKTVDDVVTGGTRNVGGTLVVSAERIGRHAQLARIVAMVADAQASRTPTQRTVDRIARALVPAALVAAVLAALGWALLGPEPQLSHALVAGVTVLIVACPAAVALATPMSAMAAADAGAHVGVLVQKPEALERMQKVDTLLVALPAIAHPIAAETDEESAASVRPGTTGALNTLRDDGITIWLLGSGDARIESSVSRRLAVPVLEDCDTPEHRSRLIRELHEQGHVVAMAGDGFLDAPALAAADVGIAMGSAAEVAMRSAGLCLPGADLAGVVRARRLAGRTRATTRQNLALALGYNLIAIPVAAGVLYPAFGVFVTPEIAAAATVLSTLSVIANSLRLRVIANRLRLTVAGSALRA